MCLPNRSTVVPNKGFRLLRGFHCSPMDSVVDVVDVVDAVVVVDVVVVVVVAAELAVASY